MATDELVLVGRVARPHGIRGHVIVNPETDFPDERFRAGEVLLVGRRGGTVPRTIAAVRFHQGRPILALEGIETMNDAEALAGAELRLPAAALGAAAGGTFYHHDLIGCEVATGRTRCSGGCARSKGRWNAAGWWSQGSAARCRFR